MCHRVEVNGSEGRIVELNTTTILPHFHLLFTLILLLISFIFQLLLLLLIQLI
nr:MAG TPA: hypothetical protein [Crassvirales sp.]